MKGEPMPLPPLCQEQVAFDRERFEPRPTAEARVRTWLEQVLRGQTQKWLLVKGPPGSGKSWFGQYLVQTLPRRYPRVEAYYLPFTTARPAAETLAAHLSFFNLPRVPNGTIGSHFERDLRAYLENRALQGVFFFVDGLDQVAPEQAREIERDWLPVLAPDDLPIALAVVRFGRINNPRLYLRGSEIVSLHSWQNPPTRNDLLCREHYQRAWPSVLSAQGTDAQYDFRYPLLNAWICHHQHNQASNGHAQAGGLWHGGLACLFARRPAMQEWARELLAWDLAPTTRPRWLDFLAGLFEQDWQEMETEDGTPFALAVETFRPHSEWQNFIHVLEKADLIIYRDYFYIMDASLWRFFHDAVRFFLLSVPTESGGGYQP